MLYTYPQTSIQCVQCNFDITFQGKVKTTWFLCSIKPCYLAGWILVECYVVAYLNPNFTEKQADARDVQEIEHGVCNISSDENSDENQMWVSIIWKSIIKIVCKIESYMWLWCKSLATYLMTVKNYGRQVQCTNIFVVQYKKMI